MTVNKWDTSAVKNALDDAVKKVYASLRGENFPQLYS